MPDHHTQQPQRPTPRQPSFLQARFQRRHPLGLPLTTGILAVLAACALFALTAVFALSPGALTMLDDGIAAWFHARTSTGLTQAVLAYTHVHSTGGMLVMSAVLAAVLWRRRAVAWLLTLAATVPGGMLVNYGLKHQFQRARPQFDHPLLILHSYSFPSGHTVAATLFYCVLAAWLVSLTRHAGHRAAIIGAAATLTLLTGLTRVYLGAHFLSDVLAAMLEGIGWFALCATVIFTLQRQQTARASSQ